MRTRTFVFDVNTLISAFLVGNHTNQQAFRTALTIGRVVCTQDIKRELADVFLREKFDKYISLENRIQILSFLETQFIEWPAPPIKIQDCRDPKDNKYLEPAAVCNAFCIVPGTMTC